MACLHRHVTRNCAIGKVSLAIASQTRKERDTVSASSSEQFRKISASTIENTAQGHGATHVLANGHPVKPHDADGPRG
eukprot:7322639-Pyramimonas_sp.AAC.1